MNLKRTTIRIEERLLKKAKETSQEKGVSLQQIVNWGLELFLYNKQDMHVREKRPFDKLPKITGIKNIDKLAIDRDYIYGIPEIK